MRLCFIHRWLVNGRSEWSPLTRTHLQECAECRSWWHDQRALEARLSERAGEFRISPGFTERVMSAIEKPQVQKATPSPSRWKVLSAAACGFGCVLIFLFFRADEPEKLAAGPLIGEEVRLMVKNNAAAVQELPARIEDPLEKELALVISDTRKALAFVADSLLPEDYRKGR